MDQRAAHLALDGLPAPEWDWLAGRLKRQLLRPGTILVEAGQPPVAAWFLLDATAAVLADGELAEHAGGTPPRTRRLGLSLVGKGHVAGASIVLGPQPSPWTIVVDHPGEAYRLVTTAAELATHAPALFERLGWAANEDFLRLSRNAVELARGTATQRVASALEDRFIAEEARVIETTHGQLSEWLGVRRATVTLALQELEAMKAIRSRRGTIELLDARRLCAAATLDPPTAQEDK